VIQLGRLMFHAASRTGSDRESFFELRVSGKQPKKLSRPEPFTGKNANHHRPAGATCAVYTLESSA
jgi:hypothetical protein